MNICIVDNSNCNSFSGYKMEQIYKILLLYFIIFTYSPAVLMYFVWRVYVHVTLTTCFYCDSKPKTSIASFGICFECLRLRCIIKMLTFPRTKNVLQ